MISDLAREIDALLPQTQCTKCGFAGCAPYAQAIADGAANYNQCPPGGAEGIARLARLLDRPVIPLDTSHGNERPRPRALIDEEICIGCTLCIQACPVDAIVGAAKQLHTVLIADCTGCDLCVAPCPVDCICMVPVTGDLTGWAAWSQHDADLAREHFTARNRRLEEEQAARERRASERAEHAEHAVPAAHRDAPAQAVPGAGSLTTPPRHDTHAAQAHEASNKPLDEDNARKQAIIQAAVERARLRRLQNGQ